MASSPICSATVTTSKIAALLIVLPAWKASSTCTGACAGKMYSLYAHARIHARTHAHSPAWQAWYGWAWHYTHARRRTHAYMHIQTQACPQAHADACVHVPCLHAPSMQCKLRRQSRELDLNLAAYLRSRTKTEARPLCTSPPFCSIHLE